MGACGIQKASNQNQKQNPAQNIMYQPIDEDFCRSDPNVLRIKQQFDDLTKLLETMSQEFKAITDSIIKIQQAEQHDQ